MPKYIIGLYEERIQMPPAPATIGIEDVLPVIARDQDTGIERAKDRFAKKYAVNRAVVAVREIAWGGDNKRAKKA